MGGRGEVARWGGQGVAFPLCSSPEALECRGSAVPLPFYSLSHLYPLTLSVSSHYLTLHSHRPFRLPLPPFNLIPPPSPLHTTGNGFSLGPRQLALHSPSALLQGGTSCQPSPHFILVAIAYPSTLCTHMTIKLLIHLSR